MKNNWFDSYNPEEGPLNIKLSEVPFADLSDELSRLYPLIKNEIETMSKETTPTFESVVLPLEKLFFRYDQCLQLASATNNLYQSEELSKIVENGVNSKINLFGELTNNYQIFKLLSEINTTSLSEDKVNIVQSWIQTFIQNGVNLKPESKTRFLCIEKELTRLELLHNELISKQTYEKTFKLSTSDCEGIPETTLQDAVRIDDEFEFNDTHTGEILTFAVNPKAREMAYRCSKSVGKSPEVNELILTVNKLRQEKSKLLGFNSYLDLSLQDKMVKNQATLNSILNPVLDSIKDKSLQKYQEIKNFGLSKGMSKINNWDISYLSNKLTEETYNFNTNELKQNFNFQTVWNGMLTFLNSWSGLSFEEIPNPNFTTYTVHQNGQMLGWLSVDFYQRENKNTGAWMDNFSHGGFNQKPWVLLACNFNENDPFLSLDDINTLFHEMGHVMHGLINNSKLPSINGTNVVEDFVEFPSQFMENLVLTPAVLDLISQNPKTLKPLDSNMAFKIKKIQYDTISTFLLRQFFYLKLDCNFHQQSFNNYSDILAMEQDLYKSLYEEVLPEEFSEINGFGHLVDNNYGGAYYSYMWASLLEKDAFVFMQDNNKQWSDIEPCFKTLGKTEMKVYETFRGSSPQVKNFLKAYLID